MRQYEITWRRALEWAIENAPDAAYRDTFTRIYNSTQKKRTKAEKAKEEAVPAEIEYTPNAWDKILELQVIAANEKPKEKFYRWNPETKKCEDNAV